MSFSLVLLAGMTAVAGYTWFPIRSMIDGAAAETRAYVIPATGTDPLDGTWPTRVAVAVGNAAIDADTIEAPQPLTPIELRVADGYERAHRASGYAWAFGLALGVIFYFRSFALTDALARRPVIKQIRAWLARRMYFDDLYDFVIVGVVRIASSLVSAVDRFLIDPALDALARIFAWAGQRVARADDAIVDGAVRQTVALVSQSGHAINLTQTGRLRTYVAAAVVAIILTGAVVVTTIVLAG